MGSCQTSNVIEINENEKKNSHRTKGLTKDDVSLMIDEQKEEFPDMKEWKGERYSGIGIKKMKGYKCDMPIDKLNEKREEFWGQRNSHGAPNYKTWRIINQACVYDELRANMLLEEYELSTADGCINHIIDNKGNHYIIPNYCINDPFFEKQYKVDSNIKQKNYKIKLFEPSSNTQIDMNLSNLLTGKELKEQFREKAKISKEFCLRLFFSGMEIKDDHFLYQHNLQNGYKIQVMKNIIDNSPPPKKDEDIPKPPKQKKKEKPVVQKEENNDDNNSKSDISDSNSNDENNDDSDD